MNGSFVSNCRPLPLEQFPLAGAMCDYGEPVEKGSWPFNVLSRHAIPYDCGLIGLPDEPLQHRHRQDELDLCRRLSAEAAELMRGMDLVRTVATVSPLLPFFMASNEEAAVVAGVSAAEVRRAFGGAIYPPTEIRIEPLREGEAWWQDILNFYDCAEGESERTQALQRWRALIAWFDDRSELTQPSFVSVGEECLPEWQGQVNPGCTFPRLLVGRSAAGSLIGVCGTVVQA
jgi:hypothetical protein